MRFAHGITGNYYVTSKNQSELIEVCEVIGKSTRGIYWSRKFKTFAFRVKQKSHKKLLKEYFSKLSTESLHN